MIDCRTCAGGFGVSVDGWRAWEVDGRVRAGCGRSCIVGSWVDGVFSDAGMEALWIRGLNLPFCFCLRFFLCLSLS